MAGAFALAGFAGGAFLGSRLGPALLSDGSSSPYAPLVSLIGAVAGGSIFAGLFESVGFAAAAQRADTRRADASTACSARCSARRSRSAWRGSSAPWRCRRRACASCAATSSARRSCSASTPSCRRRARSSTRWRASTRSRTSTGRRPTCRRRRAAIARDPRRARAAAGSVVRILGTACGLGVEGSGWVAGDGLVVTNAHVVAGEDDTVVQVRGAGPAARRDARSPSTPPTTSRCCASPGLRAPRADAGRATRRSGAEAAILGFPQQRPLRRPRRPPGSDARGGLARTPTATARSRGR